MLTDRRQFLSGALAAGLTSPTLSAEAAQMPTAAAEGVDRALWSEIRALYDVNPDYIHLGTVIRGIAPRPVREAAERWSLQSHTYRETPGSRTPPPSSRTAREEVRNLVARFVGASAEEVALTRNTTEGVTTVLSGLPLRRGDEILTSTFEHLPFYGTLMQRAQRDGIALQTVALPTPARSASDLVAAFAEAMTPRTRLVMVDHVMLSGQIMPVREIAGEARRRGARTLVDGALAVGHVPVRVRDLGCDYYAGNFHKWTGGMPGTGLLYVRSGLAAELPPLFGTAEAGPDGRILSSMAAADVSKFERGGRYEAANLLALSEALALQERIGPERLRDRLHALSRRWTGRAERLEGFRMAVSPEAGMSAGLVTWEIEGRDAGALARHLGRQRHVLMGMTDPVMAIFGIPEGRPRALILTNTAMFTSEAEVDRFAALLEEVHAGPVGRA